MMELDPGNLSRVQDAVEHLVNTARQDARYRLFGAGLAIAKTTQALGTLRHGPLHGRPQVRQVDGETCTSDSGAPGPGLSPCWPSTWRSPRRGNGRARWIR